VDAATAAVVDPRHPIRQEVDQLDQKLDRHREESAKLGNIAARAEESMRIRVDPEKCQGHNRCKAVAPELFVLDRFGNASAVGDGRVPPGFEEKARLAVANCPEMAVEIVED